MPSTKH